MIYLVSNSKPKYLDKNIKHLEVCKIKFKIFNVNLNHYDCLIITSKNAILALKYNNIVINKDIEVFVIGGATKQKCEEFGFENIYLSSNAHGNQFGKEILNFVRDKKSIYIRAKDTVSGIENILSECDLTQIIAYENVFVRKDYNLQSESIFIFTSPRNVLGFLSNFSWNSGYKAISIGNTTDMFLNDNGIKPIFTSKKQTIQDCIDYALSLL